MNQEISITPNDLRLGNYVRLKANSAIVRVVSVDFDRVGVSRPGSNLLMYVSYSEITPLELADTEGCYNKPARLLRVGDGIVYRYCLGEGVNDYVPLTTFHEMQNLHQAVDGNEISLNTRGCKVDVNPDTILP